MSAPDSLDVRLELTGPQFLNQETTGIPSERVAELNAMLKKVFAENKTDLPKLIAQVRTSLGLLPNQLADSIDMARFRYKATEKDLPGAYTRKEGERYTDMFAAWRLKAVSEGVREQCLQLLIGEATLDGLYQRMGVDIGGKEMENRIPNIWSRLLQRKNFPEGFPPTVPDFLEVLQHVDQLYPEVMENEQNVPPLAVERRRARIAEATTLWETEKWNGLRIRALPEPLIRLHVALEQRIATEHQQPMTLKFAHEIYGVSSPILQKLLNGEMVPWEDVKPLAEALGLTVGASYRTEWEEQYDIEFHRPKFRDAFFTALSERGYSLNDLARWLGISSESESLRFRADNVIRSVLDENVNSSQVPIAALIALVAKDDKEKDQLTKAFNEERTLYYRRTGSWLRGEGLHMRLERELAGEGVDLEQLIIACCEKTGKNILR